MKKTGKTILVVVIGLIVIAGFVFWKDVRNINVLSAVSDGKPGKEKKGKNKNGNEQVSAGISSDVSIVKQWDLPAELMEISGISYVDEQRVACVQDEEGIVFIYNLSTEKIEKKIPFAAAGDYEGIAVKGSTVFVVRADGKLFSVDINQGQSSAKEYNTELTVKHNVEGLCYDKDNDRLLLAIKDNEPLAKDYKGIYAFQLVNNSFVKEPVYKVMIDGTTTNARGKKSKVISPSAITIHPQTKEIYITDGPQSQLVLLNADGSIKQTWELGKSFAQPEGLMFTPTGDLYISNEGTKQPGNIVKVQVQ